MKENFIETIFIVILLFNGITIATSQLDTFKKFPNKHFVETGSLMGTGIERALQAGFLHVYSIELSDYFFGECKKKFSNNHNVKLFLGNSGDILYEVIKDIDSPITFWLDGHYSKGLTAKGDELCPILKELDQIKKHHLNIHTILIDDVRLFGTEQFDFITLEQVIQKLLEINPNYHFSYEDGHTNNDILVAQP